MHWGFSQQTPPVGCTAQQAIDFVGLSPWEPCRQARDMGN